MAEIAQREREGFNESFLSREMYDPQNGLSDRVYDVSLQNIKMLWDLVNGGKRTLLIPALSDVVHYGLGTLVDRVRGVVAAEISESMGNCFRMWIEDFEESVFKDWSQKYENPALSDHGYAHIRRLQKFIQKFLEDPELWKGDESIDRVHIDTMPALFIASITHDALQLIRDKDKKNHDFLGATLTLLMVDEIAESLGIDKRYASYLARTASIIALHHSSYAKFSAENNFLWDISPAELVEKADFANLAPEFAEYYSDKLAVLSSDKQSILHGLDSDQRAVVPRLTELFAAADKCDTLFGGKNSSLRTSLAGPSFSRSAISTVFWKTSDSRDESNSSVLTEDEVNKLAIEKLREVIDFGLHSDSYPDDLSRKLNEFRGKLGMPTYESSQWYQINMLVAIKEAKQVFDSLSRGNDGARELVNQVRSTEYAIAVRKIYRKAKAQGMDPDSSSIVDVFARIGRYIGEWEDSLKSALQLVNIVGSSVRTPDVKTKLPKLNENSRRVMLRVFDLLIEERIEHFGLALTLEDITKMKHDLPYQGYFPTQTPHQARCQRLD